MLGALKRFGPIALVMLVMLGGCSDALVAEGGHCATSAQCGPGLLCNTAVTPAVCSTNGTPHIDDAAIPQDLTGADLFGVDLAGADLSTSPPPDMAGQDLAAADLSAMVQPDLALHD